ncbi:unnamed protein product [Rhizoctonia solani]|uniref:Laminin domain protein n=1 Tax=Rhizoctonia solani TaxID=456999 RepID=A0A8H3A100_9AGAM|nr:unnamed protein product [Rhizoctonia solani]
MTTHLNGQILSPPELPPYLKTVHDLKPILGAPSDEEVIGIHAVMRIANQVVDVEDLGNPTLLARLSEHLFDVQMVKYRSKYLGMFPEDTTFTPPVLPAHLSVHLNPVTGAPSEEMIIQVQSAIRSYQQYANSSYVQRAKCHNASMPDELPSSNPARVIERAADVAEEPNAASNNVGSGSDVFDLNQLAHVLQDIGITDAIERSNRLAEQANQLARRSNQLIEKSNQIAEHSNQLIEWSSQPAEQSNKLFKKFNELFERLNQHLEESNSLAEESTKPTE